MPWTVDWELGASTLFTGIENFPDYTKQKLYDLMLNYAIKVQEYAKSNASWADRTGAARSGLEVDVADQEDRLVLSLFHTVSYGLYLEVRWGATYAIILPTLEQLGPDLLNQFNDIISEIIYYD